MRKERINEIWGVFFLLLGLFTVASLFFFHRDDISFYSSQPLAKLQNPTGLIGTYLAHGLTLAFGMGSYMIPVVLLMWSWCFFTQRIPERKIFKFVGLGIGLIAASVFLGISFYSETRFLRAGAVGYVLGTELLRYFGPVGSYVITGSCFLLAVLLATDFLIYPILKTFWENIVSFISGISSAAGKVTEGVRQLVTILPKAKPQQKIQKKEKEIIPKESAFRRDSPPPSLKVKTYGGEDTVMPPLMPKEVEVRIKTESPKIELPKKEKEKEPPSKETKPAPVPVRLSVEPKEGEEYHMPSLDLLRKPAAAVIHSDDLRQNSRIVEETLSEFGIEARVVEVEQGPVITRYELLPAPGVKVTKILSLSDDLAMALKASSLRFIAPIPGKSAIGIEVPNTKSSMVYLRELLESKEFKSGEMALPLVIGKDTSGKPLIADLAQMPHLLIAGTTGSGKTVCVNSIIAGLLYHSTPEQLKFVMIDPKMVELAIYGAIPHMLSPVVTDPKKASATLGWVVAEMDNRYRLFAMRAVRNIQSFNAQFEEKLPYIVVIIDELADLMMVAQDKVEGCITRLAQLSRAVGIHLILATQRPSVDVITGVIKANFPARISFKVASKVDSRTVLDLNGADKLLGKGDLLFLMPGEAKLIRGQGTFVVDEEISAVAKYVSEQKAPEFHPEIELLSEGKSPATMDQEKDELYEEAVNIVLASGIASSSTLQRRLRLGYTRAARIIDQMEAEGIVGPLQGSKPRDILVDRAQALQQSTTAQP